MATTVRPAKGQSSPSDKSARSAKSRTTDGRSWPRPGWLGVVGTTVGGVVVTTWLALVATAAHASPIHGGHVAQAAAEPVASDGEMRLLRDVLIVDRTIGYLAIAALCGGWLFLAVVWPAGAGVRRTRRVLTIAWLAGFLSTVAGLGLQAATVRRAGFGGVFDTGAVADVLDTGLGRAWAARALLYLLTLPLLGALARDAEHAARAVWWRVAALAVAAGLLRTLGLVGHSTETTDSTLGAVADFVHVAAIAAWIGGLVLLAVVVPRFSTIAKYAVGVVVVAGTVLTWVVVGGVDDLLHTHYGRVLLLKLAILAAVLVAAWCSKRWVDARLRLAVVLEGDAVTVRPFVVSVAAEVVLAVALLGVASVLVSTSPGT
jgi:copper transport protein